jgi:hypothetical protein
MSKNLAGFWTAKPSILGFEGQSQSNNSEVFGLILPKSGLTGQTYVATRLQAEGDVSVFGIDDVTAAVESLANVELFAGRSLVANVEAGVDASAVSLGTLAANLQAGRDDVGISLGSSVVGIVAGRDVTAASYEVMHANLFGERSVIHIFDFLG